MAPVGRQSPQLDGLCPGYSLGHVEAEGRAVDGRPGRDVVGDVKSDHAATDEGAVGLARDEVTAGAVADVARGALLQRVVFAGTENDGRGHDPSLELLQL